MKLQPAQLEELLAEADAARSRVSGYSDEHRADLEDRGRALISKKRSPSERAKVRSA